MHRVSMRHPLTPAEVFFLLAFLVERPVLGRLFFAAAVVGVGV